MAGGSKSLCEKRGGKSQTSAEYRGGKKKKKEKRKKAVMVKVREMHVLKERLKV